MFERQQELHRPLADVARAPGRALILLQAVRGGEVDERVVDHPWEKRVEAGGVAAAALQAHAPAHARPEFAGRARHRGRADIAFVFPREPGGLGRIGHRACHGEAELESGRGAHRDVGQPARLAVRIKQFVAAQGFHFAGRARDEMIGRAWIGLAPKRIRVRPEGEVLGAGVHLDDAGMAEIALAQHELAEDQEAAGLALNRDFPLDRGILLPRRRRERRWCGPPHSRANGNRLSPSRKATAGRGAATRPRSPRACADRWS